MNKFKQKFMTMLTLTLTLGSVFPYSAINTAEAATAKAEITDAKIQTAGSELSETNKVAKGAAVDVELGWSTTADAVLEEGEQQVFSLPKNLEYQETTNKALAGNAGSYSVDAQAKTLTMQFKKNHVADEATGMAQEVRPYAGKLQLAATTKSEATAATETVTFKPGLTKTIYYMEESSDDDGEPEQEPAQKEATNKEVKAVAETKSEIEPAAAPVRRAPKDLTNDINLFDSVKFYGMFDDGNGGKVEKEITPENPLTDPSFVKMDMAWSLPDDFEVVPGDTYTFQVNKPLEIHNKVSGENEYCSFTVETDGKMTIIFKEGIDQVFDRKGKFGVESSISVDYKDKEVEIETDIKDKDGSDITLVVDVPQPSIEKKALYYDETTNRIVWEIIINEEKYPLMNAIVTDNMVKGMSFSDKTQVYRQDGFNPDGSPNWVLTTRGAGSGTYWRDGWGDNGQQIIFKDQPMSDTVRIVVEGTISDPTLDAYTNKAKLTGDNFVNVNTSAEFTKQQMSNYKELKSYDPATGIIKWEVKVSVNETKDTLTEKTFKDNKDLATHYFNGNFTWTKDGQPMSPAPTMNTTDQKDSKPVGIEFTGLEPGTYVINYETQAFVAPMPEGTVITNYADYDKQMGGDTSVHWPVDVGVEKTSTGIDYNTNKMTWVSTINKGYKKMKDLVITDTYTKLDGTHPTKHVLDPTSLVINATTKNGPVVTLTSGTHYVLKGIKSDTDFSAGFTVQMLAPYDDTNVKLVLTYDTIFDRAANGVAYPSAGGGFYNSIKLAYKDEDNNERHQGSQAKKEVDWRYDRVGMKAGKYVQKGDSLDFPLNPDDAEKSQVATEDTIYWHALLNQTKKNYKKGTIITEYLKANQVYDESSVQLREATIETPAQPGTDYKFEIGQLGNTLVKGVDYLVRRDSNNDIEIELLRDINVSFVLFIKAKPTEGIFEFKNTVGVAIPGKEEVYVNGTVTVAAANKWMVKEGVQSKVEDGMIDWEILVNQDNRRLANATIKDTVDDTKQSFVVDGNKKPKVTIYKAVKSGKTFVKGDVVSGDEYTVDLVTSNSERTQEMTITFKEEITEAYIVTYQTALDPSLNGITTIYNSAELYGKDKRIVHVAEKVETKQTSGWGTSQGVAKNLKITKVDDSGNLITSDEVTFKLYRGTGANKIEYRDITLTGTDTVTRIPAGMYTLVEIEAPDGYLIGEPKEYVVDLIGSESKTIEIEVKNKQATTHTVVKEWEGDNGNKDGNRPAEITVDLYDVTDPKAPLKLKKKTQTLTAATDWTYTWNNLDMYKTVNGIRTPITYAAKETSEVENYTKTEKSDAKGTVITNTYEPEVIKIPVTKNWDDASDQDGKRPDSVKFELYANGELTDHQPVAITATGDIWSYEFQNLPRDYDQKAIVYEVKEVQVPDYEAPVVTGDQEDGFTVTNKRVPSEIEIGGEKIWDDGDDQDGIRPVRITVELYANGTKIDSLVTSAPTAGANEWDWSFGRLPTHENKQEILYEVKEVAVEGYTTTITGNVADGFTINNFHKPKEIEISGEKVWKDNNDQDGIRPDSITLELLADGTKVKEITVPKEADNTWSYTFGDLPVYDAGSDISYEIREVTVDGYTSEITGDVENGFVVTNSHEPSEIEINGEKVWEDASDQDGKRPTEITVELLANGTKVKETQVTGTGNTWSYKFENLPEYEAGEKISYTVNELTVADYTTDINGLTITNSHTPSEIAIEGEKVWEDNSDQDGKRPETITVKLLANDQEVKTTEVSGTGNSWSYSFTGLPEYEAGKKIVYTVEEEKVPGYTTTIDGTTITNSHTPEKATDIAGEKFWFDNENKYGKRPDQIELYLVKSLDGIRPGINASTDEEQQAAYDAAKVAGSDITVSADENGKWTYNWNDMDLPKFEDGKEISYFVVEKQVEHYGTGYDNGDSENEIEGNYTERRYNVMNRESELQAPITVDFKKIWNDANNEAKLRPQAIQVKIMYEGREEPLAVKDVTIDDLDEDGSWSDSWEIDPNLFDFVMDSSKVYVEEITVPGYESTVDKYTITNTLKTIDKTVEKIWVDNNDQDGKRPESINVQLLQNGKKMTTGKYQEVQPVSVNEDGTWTYEFTGLPAEDASGKAYEYSIEEVNVPEGYTSNVDGMTITNTYTPEKTQWSVEKKWTDAEDNDGLRPKLVEVQLYADDKPVGTPVELSDENNWKYSWNDLDKFMDGKVIGYSVKEIAASEWEDHYTPSYDSEGNKTIITNTHTQITIDPIVTKVWVGDEKATEGTRPESITVELFADGESVAKETFTGKDDTWSYQFTGLPKYAKGKEIVYTLKEVAVPKDYTSVVDGMTVTNTYTPEKPKPTPIPEVTSIPVTKIWKDNSNEAKKRPSEIKVELYANGKETGKILPISGEGDKWTKEFENLPVKENGKDIEYSVKEVDVPEGYTSNVDGMTITNTYTPEKPAPEVTSIPVTKIWKDNSNEAKKRPSEIKVELYANGKETGKILPISGEGDTWTKEFENLPVKENGKDIEYSVKEVDVPEGYTSNVDGMTITNTYTPEKPAPEVTSIPVTKIWKDNSDEAKKRPSEIKVELYANGKETGKILLINGEGDKWTKEFENLPVKENGKDIEYSVKEVDVPAEYTAVEKGMTVTNTYTPEKTTPDPDPTPDPEPITNTIDINIKKVWDDNSDVLKLRPEKIKVQLFANDEKQPRHEATIQGKGDTWSHTFENLPADEDGKTIKYSIKEVAVKNYEATYKGDAEKGFTITNTVKRPGLPETGGNSNTTTNTSNRPLLPQTGSELLMWMPALGMALILVAILGYSRKRRNLK